MKLLTLILCALFIVPAYASGTKPGPCGGNNPPPPNPVTPTVVKKHKSDDGISFAEGAAILVIGGITCNLIEGCRTYVGTRNETP